MDSRVSGPFYNFIYSNKNIFLRIILKAPIDRSNKFRVYADIVNAKEESFITISFVR